MNLLDRKIFGYYSVLSRTRIARIYTDSGCGVIEFKIGYA